MHSCYSFMMAGSVVGRESKYTRKWCYELGLVLKPVFDIWKDSGDIKYFTYVKNTVDRFVQPDGSISTYRLESYNIDNINCGKVLFPLYKETGEQKYKKAAELLRKQLKSHPRTNSQGFWHKFIYPHQIWLDGIYMGLPFLAEFGKTFNEPECFDDAAHQVIFIASKTKEPLSGLFFHGWDESKEMKWADPESGCSPNIWGRAVGWFAMAIVDILDFLPYRHIYRNKILEIFQELIKSIISVRDEKTGLWYQVLDQGNREGNYIETSSSSMFIYAIAKGVNKGYLDESYLEIANKGYSVLIDKFIEVDSNGNLHLNNICEVAGLGGKPYRDGSYSYYIGEPVVTDDYKGVGPFIMASAELERRKNK